MAEDHGEIRSAIDHIHRAFAEVEYPGDDNLVRRGTYTYCDEVLAFVGITDWKKVPAYAFGPAGRDPRITEFRIERIRESLTPEQRAAVVSFLRVMEKQTGKVDTDAATRALRLMAEIERQEQG